MAILFTSHGAPDIALHDNATTRFWREWAVSLPTPRRIVVLSAHWYASTPLIGAHPQPETVHDFAGFDEALYRLRYSAPGDAMQAYWLAQQLSLSVHPAQGLDHGMWIPLLFMYPQTDIPLIPVAMPASYSLDELWRFGEHLAAQLSEHDLLLCSGASSHNLPAIFRREVESEARVQAFRDWLLPRVADHDRAALIRYRHDAPHAAWNHPQDDHLRPLFVALGAAGQRVGHHHLSETTYRVLPMDHWWWS